MSYQRPPRYTNGLPGVAWDLERMRSITPEIASAMEADAVAMFRYLAEDGQLLQESWFFKYGGICALTEESTGICRKQEDLLWDSPSWILKVVSTFIWLYRLKILTIALSALGQEKEIPTLAEALTIKKLPKAKTDAEAEFLQIVIENLEKFLELSPAGLEAFRRKEVPVSSGRNDNFFSSSGKTTVPVAFNGLSPDLEEGLQSAAMSAAKGDTLLLLKKEKPQPLYPSSCNRDGVSVDAFCSNVATYRSRIENEKKAFFKKKRDLTTILDNKKRAKAARKKNVGKVLRWIVALAAVAALFFFLIWPKFIFPNLSNDVLYTPEILQSFSGAYRTSNVNGDAIVTITSCDENGRISGYFEFIVDGDYGKYSIEGQITKKKNNGNLALFLDSGAWIVEHSDYVPLERMEVEIYDDYQSFECAQYSMDWSIGYEAGSIKTAEDLKNLRGATGTFRLKNDIDLLGADWTPIADFSGTLIGNGYTVKNLSINASSSDVGLFSVLEGRVVNLKIESARIEVGGRNENVGILCGRLKGTALNVSVSGSVSANLSEAVGGVCGNVATVGSYNLSNIESNATVSGLNYVGGVFGKVNDSISNGVESYSLLLSNLRNRGAVTGESNVGGIAGYVNAEATGFGGRIVTYILDCSNEGKISGQYYVGGIVGSAYGYSTGIEPAISEIGGCTNTSEIVAEAYVGCIAGLTSKYKVFNCSNENSTLTATGRILEDGKSYAYVGGFVGRGYCKENCTNKVLINYTGGGMYVGGVIGYCDYAGSIAMKNLKNEARVVGASYVGGIMGALYDYGSNNTSQGLVTMEAFVNSGDVSGTGNNVGGHAGYVSGEFSGFTGSLSFAIYDGQNSGRISGISNVGGLFGCLDSTDGSLTMEGCASTGSVAGEASLGEVIGLDKRK